MIERGVYPDRVGALVAGMDLQGGSITERLEELGIVFADAEHVIDAVPASAEDARLLGVSPRVPMLRERRLTTDLAGTPVEWSDDRYLGSAVAFSVHNSTAVNALSRTPGAQDPIRAPSSGAKCANPGGVTSGSLAWSSQRRTATASRPCGSASNATASSGLIGPPCSASVRTDSGEQLPDGLDRGHGLSSRAMPSRGGSGGFVPPGQHGQGAGQAVQVRVAALQVSVCGRIRRLV